ncbi:MAG: DegV family protein [Clostridiales bacterium]|nr:DegV family protein [Clostridiales bacterium]
MVDYLIFTDVSSDVYSDEALSHICLIPMDMTVGEDSLTYEQMGDNEYIKHFYDDIRNGKIVKTSQITPHTYKEIFEPFLEGEFGIIYLSLSSGLSSTFESAKEAANNLKNKYPDAKIYPVDSLSATGGMGMIVERMLKNKNNGMSIEDNVADIEEFKKKIYVNCFVNDLMHLKRGGRIGSATAAFGTLLNIKPLIYLTEQGTLQQFSKAKGEQKAITAMSEAYRTLADFTSQSPVYVCHADNVETAENLEKLILSINGNADIRVGALSPIIGTHLGPGSVVLCFIKK